jgi:hypothetical protein
MYLNFTASLVFKEFIIHNLKLNLSNQQSSYALQQEKKLYGLWSESELYRPSDRHLSAKLVPTLADRGCRVVSATNPHGR